MKDKQESGGDGSIAIGVAGDGPRATPSFPALPGPDPWWAQRLMDAYYVPSTGDGYWTAIPLHRAAFQDSVLPPRLIWASVLSRGTQGLSAIPCGSRAPKEIFLLPDRSRVTLILSIRAWERRRGKVPLDLADTWLLAGLESEPEFQGMALTTTHLGLSQEEVINRIKGDREVAGRYLELGVVLGDLDFIQMVVQTVGLLEHHGTNRFSLLHWAALLDHEHVLSFLLAQGADVDALSNHRWTPLHLGGLLGHDLIVKILLEHKAKTDVLDTFGLSPLRLAEHEAHQEVMDILLPTRPPLAVEVVDLDALIKHWAELWAKSPLLHRQMDWYCITGHHALYDIAEDRAFEERVRRDYPDIEWPPRLSIDYASSDPVDIAPDLKPVEPEIVTVSSRHWFDEEEAPFFVKKNLRPVIQLFADHRLESMISPSGFDVFWAEQKQIRCTTDQDLVQAFNEPIDIEDEIAECGENQTAVLLSHKSACTIQKKVVLSGYVVVAADKPMNPGDRYTQHIGDAHKLWVVPIDKVFEDLRRYRNERRISPSLVQSLNVFDESKEVCYQTQLYCEVPQYHQWVVKDETEVAANIDREMVRFERALVRHHREHSIIQHLFHETLQMNQYYADLSIVSSRDFSQLEASLKDSQDSFEAQLVYHQMVGSGMNTCKHKDLLPTKRARKILITGTAGVGKTTLSKKLASDHKHWCFCIPLRNLNEDKYPSRADKPYTLAEILIKESYPPVLWDRVLPLLDNPLYEDYFEQLVLANSRASGVHYLSELRSKRPKQVESVYQRLYLSYLNVPLWVPVGGSVILDGYDEANIPGYLEPVFRQLMQSPQLIITSRPYNLNGIDKYDFSPDEHVEITGFNQQVMEAYIHDFFASLSYHYQGSAKGLIAHLNLSPYIRGACQIPVNCEMVCMAWGWGLLNKQAVTMSALYRSLLLTLSHRYTRKFVDLQRRSFEDLDREQVSEYCLYPTAFAEYFAFWGLAKHKLFMETVEARKYLPQPKQDSALLEQKRFGFIKPVSVGGRLEQGEYYFNHLTFRDYFAARYLATALQVASGSSRRISDYYRWKLEGLEGVHSVEDFIQRRKFDPSFEYVIWFIVGLLAESGDTIALAYFYRLLLKEPYDRIGLYNTLIFLRCLEDSGFVAVTSLDEQAQGMIIASMQQWLDYFFTHRTDKINPLWERFKLSKKLLMHSSMEPYFREVICKASDAQLASVLSFLDTVDFLTPYLVEALAERLLSMGSNRDHYLSVIVGILLTQEDCFAFLSEHKEVSAGMELIKCFLCEKISDILFNMDDEWADDVSEVSQMGDDDSEDTEDESDDAASEGSVASEESVKGIDDVSHVQFVDMLVKLSQDVSPKVRELVARALLDLHASDSFIEQALLCDGEALTVLQDTLAVLRELESAPEVEVKCAAMRALAACIFRLDWFEQSVDQEDFSASRLAHCSSLKKARALFGKSIDQHETKRPFKVQLALLQGLLQSVHQIALDRENMASSQLLSLLHTAHQTPIFQHAFASLPVLYSHLPSSLRTDFINVLSHYILPFVLETQSPDEALEWLEAYHSMPVVQEIVRILEGLGEQASFEVKGALLQALSGWALPAALLEKVYAQSPEAVGAFFRAYHALPIIGFAQRQIEEIAACGAELIDNPRVIGALSRWALPDQVAFLQDDGSLVEAYCKQPCVRTVFQVFTDLSASLVDGVAKDVVAMIVTTLSRWALLGNATMAIVCNPKVVETYTQLPAIQTIFSALQGLDQEHICGDAKTTFIQVLSLSVDVVLTYGKMLGVVPDLAKISGLDRILDAVQQLSHSKSLVVISEVLNVLVKIKKMESADDRVEPCIRNILDLLHALVANSEDPHLPIVQLKLFGFLMMHQPDEVMDAMPLLRDGLVSSVDVDDYFTKRIELPRRHDFDRNGFQWLEAYGLNGQLNDGVAFFLFAHFSIRRLLGKALKWRDCDLRRAVLKVVIKRLIKDGTALYFLDNKCYVYETKRYVGLPLHEEWVSQSDLASDISVVLGELGLEKAIALSALTEEDTTSGIPPGISLASSPRTLFGDASGGGGGAKSMDYTHEQMSALLSARRPEGAMCWQVEHLERPAQEWEATFTSIQVEVQKAVSLVMPIGLANGHWVALFVEFEADDLSAPIITYLDPGKGGLPERLAQSIEAVFPEADISTRRLKIAKDFTSDASGIWLVEGLTALWHEKPLPKRSFDIAKARKMQLDALRELTELSSSEGDGVSP